MEVGAEPLTSAALITTKPFLHSAERSAIEQVSSESLDQYRSAETLPSAALITTKPFLHSAQRSAIITTLHISPQNADKSRCKLGLNVVEFWLHHHQGQC